MQYLTREEFNDRIQSLQRARKIFNNLTGNNITASFEAYQAILAEKDREIMLSSDTAGDRFQSFMDRFERPKCECGSDMLIRVVPENQDGVVTQLYCSNRNCDIVLDTPYSVEEWIKMLKRKK